MISRNKQIIIMILVIFCLFIFSSGIKTYSSPQGSHTLYSIEETFADEINPDEPQYTKSLYIGYNLNPMFRFLFIKFNFTDILKPYTNATLRLYVKSWVVGTCDLKVEIHNVTEPWNQTTLTWNNKPDNSSTVYANYTFPIDVSNYWAEIVFFDLSIFDSAPNGIVITPIYDGIYTYKHIYFLGQPNADCPQLVLEGPNLPEIQIQQYTFLLFMVSLIIFCITGHKKDKIRGS